MNQTRLLRLNRGAREQYIRKELNGMKINQLKRFVREYGLNHTKEMSKTELIDVLTGGLMDWVEKELNAIHLHSVSE